jgi:AraC-like DNA-binding protein
MPPGEYLNQLRISIAQALLIKGRAVEQIAHEVGYGDSTALTRAFTARTGMSPTNWLASQAAETQ